MQGAILGVASIVVRLIGIVYRVPLNNILGEKGVAYYGVAFDVYSILLLLSSYSLPLAVSKMVSKRVTLKQYKNTRRIFIFALAFAFLCGLIAFCITFFGADFFANLLNYPQSAIALKVLSPALIILSIMGVIRGYFQGLGTMIPTAVSNIVEQIVNAVISLVAASALFKSVSDAQIAKYSFNNVREAYGAAGGTLGTLCGAGAALLFLIFLFLIYRKILKKQIQRDTTDYVEPIGSIFKVLILTIVPVILSTTIYNISGLLDTGLFSNIMEAKGMNHDTIDVLTGMFTGNYRLLVNVPIALASALASSLIPSVVKSMAIGNRGEVIRKIESSIKVTMMVAFPCAVGIGVLSRQIMGFLFPTSSDPDKVSLMFIVGCISIVLYSLSTITNSILQGIDKMRIPVIHSAIALVVHVIILIGMIYFLNINIFSVVICDALFALIVCILNALSLNKYLGYKQEVKNSIVMPAVCSLIMGIFAYLISFLIFKFTKSYAISVMITIIVAVVIYGILLMILKVIDADEMAMIPGGNKLYRIAKKLHFMK